MTTNSLHQSPVILAVDNDKDDLTLLTLLLRKAGVEHPLELYREGEEIVAALRRAVESSMKALRPILCFLDVRMERFTGHDVLRWIRAQPALNNLPVVMLSQSDSPRDVTAAVQHGAQCYLTKYPQPAVLREVVSEAERFALGAPADECFRLPTNQLLVRCRRLNPDRGIKPR
jgi:CheY-like chemotaxis protein